MFKIVIFLTFIPGLTHQISTLRACTPNSQLILNGLLCFCDNRGHLNEANCRTISRRQSCQPGQIIWQGCNQCICQEKGYLLCSNSHCSDFKPPILRQGLAIYGLRCSPFRSYYINCSICVCPASGITNEAQCVTDVSCNPQSSGLDISRTAKTYCIPNVMYLSPCLQCLCPDHGYFDIESCVEKCKQTSSSIFPVRLCFPRTLYRIGCDICKCPDSGVADDSFCIDAVCNNTSLQVLRTDIKECTAYSFSSSRCMYCDCNSKGVVNENACLEIDCAKTNKLGKQNIGTAKCHAGEMVPICTECFCTESRQTIAKYCSRDCSYQNRINILENVLKDASQYDLIETSQIKRVTDKGLCTPNSLYLDNGRYCLCPENGSTHFKFCTSVTENVKALESQDFVSNNIEIDYNSPCEPNTFVEFDCNTCYCNRNGKIDPKWCTYDDCQAKRLVQESHATKNMAIEDDASGTCHPGAILKVKCNFCICPESGILKEKACTQNNCTEFDQTMHNDKLTCEPLAYFEVDCNICYCPRDGIKNVAKCTKNLCEKATLRSDSCIPGQLFTVGCNLCVCPPDGNKMGKACTNYDCPEVAPGKWLELFDDLADNHVTINYSRSLDHCFPGEEFVVGCKLCICPELGLKMYATCESVLCDEKIKNARHVTAPKTVKKAVNTSSLRYRRKTHDCFVYNVSTSAERQDCTPGTMYIIRCMECICPYFGNINNFCRPMAKNRYCEQAFPYFNYLPMGRRRITGKITETKKIKATKNVPNTTDTELKSKEVIQVHVTHDKHTEFRCEKLGTILDKCFICDCEKGNVVIEEHCFKSDADSCANAKPTFLYENKVDF